MKISIIGTGYVGLPVGACFANQGHEIVCVDNIVDRITLLNSGNIPLYEPGLPDFLREGKAIYDFLHPDRIVIGVESERAEKIMKTLYAHFLKNNVPILFCKKRSAEMIKYATSSFLGIKISYTNELADLCEKLDVDIRDVVKGMAWIVELGIIF